MSYMMSKAGNLGDSVGHWCPHLMFHVPKTKKRVGEQTWKAHRCCSTTNIGRSGAGNDFHGARLPLVRRHRSATSGNGLSPRRSCCRMQGTPDFEGPNRQLKLYWRPKMIFIQSLIVTSVHPEARTQEAKRGMAPLSFLAF